MNYRGAKRMEKECEFDLSDYEAPYSIILTGEIDEHTIMRQFGESEEYGEIREFGDQLAVEATIT